MFEAEKNKQLDESIMDAFKALSKEGVNLTIKLKDEVVKMQDSSVVEFNALVKKLDDSQKEQLNGRLKQLQERENQKLSSLDRKLQENQHKTQDIADKLRLFKDAKADKEKHGGLLGIIPTKKSRTAKKTFDNHKKALNDALGVKPGDKKSDIQLMAMADSKLKGLKDESKVIKDSLKPSRAPGKKMPGRVKESIIGKIAKSKVKLQEQKPKEKILQKAVKRDELCR